MRIILSLIVSVLLATAAMGQKFAFVNSDYILENIPEYKDAQKALDGLSVGWQKEIENKYTEIDRMYKSYQADQILLTEDMKKKREQEIVDKEKEVKELQKTRFGKDGDLFRKRKELVKPIQDKIFNAIKKFSTAGNYAIIFDKSSESVAMLYTNPKYDKSDDILKLMGYNPGPKAQPAAGGTTGGGAKPGTTGTPKTGTTNTKGGGVGGGDSKTVPTTTDDGGEEQDTRPQPTEEKKP